MFNSITWGQYFAFLGLVSLLYYFFIGYKYFKWEILNFIGIKKIEPAETQIPVAELKKQFNVGNHTEYMPGDNTENHTQAFADEVKAYLYQASPAAPKEELLLALKQIVSKYPAAKNMESKSALNELILRETEKHYQGLMQQEDLTSIWL
jgi:hypothetical protein